MLYPDRIPAWRLQSAFQLTDNDMQGLLTAMQPKNALNFHGAWGDWINELLASGEAQEEEVRLEERAYQIEDDICRLPNRYTLPEEKEELEETKREIDEEIASLQEDFDRYSLAEFLYAFFTMWEGEPNKSWEKIVTEIIEYILCVQGGVLDIDSSAWIQNVAESVYDEAYDRQEWLCLDTGELLPESYNVLLTGYNECGEAEFLDEQYRIMDVYDMPYPGNDPRFFVYGDGIACGQFFGRVFLRESEPKLKKIIRDSVLLNKEKAIRYLYSCDYHFQQEVKGLTRAYIEKVLSPTSEKRTEADQSVSAVPATSQGGSNPETDKIQATTAACRVVITAISDGYHLNEAGRIGCEKFSNTVKEVMTNHGTVLLFQVSTAKKIFTNDPAIQRFKTRRGRPKTQ